MTAIDEIFGEAAAALPWVAMPCPQMPHEYVVRSAAPAWAWDYVCERVSARNRSSYRAYFRGYQFAMRYWEGPDGRRYWQTGYMLNRCDQASVEPPRRVTDHAKAIADWDGPPWAPNGSEIYDMIGVDRRGRRHWAPSAATLAHGYQPCKSCCRWLRTHRDRLPPGACADGADTAAR